MLRQYPDDVYVQQAYINEAKSSRSSFDGDVTSFGLAETSKQDPGFITPFMQKEKFTFTVLPAYDYARNTLKVFEIPQNWIVDASGVVRLQGTGYDSTEKWQEGMTDAIQKYAPAAASADAASDSRK